MTLFTSASARKYILYAAGEIILVMLGILLALQVNNWNEHRKNRQKEMLLLQQIHREFSEYKAQFEFALDKNKESFSNIRKFMTLFPIDLYTISRDTLNDYITRSGLRGAGWTFNPSNAVINAMASTNSFELISNETLRYKILSWNGILEDFMEDQHKVVNYTFESYRPYLAVKGLMNEKGFLDERVDISFVATPEFESMINIKYNTLSSITNLANEQLFPEVKLLQQTMDDIIELTGEE